MVQESGSHREKMKGLWMLVGTGRLDHVAAGWGTGEVSNLGSYRNLWCGVHGYVWCLTDCTCIGHLVMSAEAYR